ncbi:MAG TPA: hypothetical protein VOA87_05095 [Thermoanaerobaculia bacterium]|nr:hypothetical protein [Thermoanaerobaculia bacterium]
MPLRGLIPVVALAFLLGAGAPAAADLVVLRDGSTQSGQVKAFVADRCQLAGDWPPVP